jgi:hypothetical protein
VPFGTSPARHRPRSGSVRRRSVPVVLLAGVVGAAIAAANPTAAYADVIDPTGPPAAPASMTVEAGAASLTVGWTPPAADGGTAITGYDVVAAPADSTIGLGPVATLTDPSATATTLSGLTNGVDYTVTVAATNASGAGPAATADGTPRTVPDGTVLTGASAADHSATVSWQAPASDGGSAVLDYVVTAQPSGRSTTVAAGSTVATIGGLLNGSATTLSVAAVNAAGTGPATRTGVVIPRRPARLALAAAPARLITYGSLTHLTARLTDTAGHPIAARRIVLSYRVGTGAYRTAAIGTTGATGRVALTAKLPATATLALRHAADAIAGVSTSVGVVRVARRVTESAPRAVLVGHYVTTTGAVSPRRAVGARVMLQRLIAGQWTAVATGTMTSRTSYRVSWKPRSAGFMSLRVVVPGDAYYAAGAGRAWRQAVSAETVASIATTVLRSTRITLATVHESGVSDNATAQDDVQALAGRHWAPRSAYQNAPGGSTPVDIRLMRALRALGGAARVQVSEIAGGSHAPGSAHYQGEAIDITVVNGVSIAAGGNYTLVASVCRSYGASVVYDPAYDPYGGHGNHVHCQWGTPASD